MGKMELMTKSDKLAPNNKISLKKVYECFSVLFTEQQLFTPITDVFSLKYFHFQKAYLKTAVTCWKCRLINILRSFCHSILRVLCDFCSAFFTEG